MPGFTPGRSTYKAYYRSYRPREWVPGLPGYYHRDAPIRHGSLGGRTWVDHNANRIMGIPRRRPRPRPRGIIQRDPLIDNYRPTRFRVNISTRESRDMDAFQLSQEREDRRQRTRVRIYRPEVYDLTGEDIISSIAAPIQRPRAESQAAGGGYASPTISTGTASPFPEYRGLNAMRRNPPLRRSVRRPNESLQAWLERRGLPSSFP